MSLRSLLVFSLLLLGLSASGQKPKEILEEAETLYAQGDYARALGQYLLYHNLDPKKEEALLRLGHCYLEIDEPAEAAPFLREYLDTGKPEPEGYLYLARARQLQGEFEEAARIYKAFLRRIPEDDARRAAVKSEILRCGFGSRWKYHEAVAFVDNLGPEVNTSADETAPALSPNYDSRLYFSSNRPGVKGGKRNREGFADEAGERKLDLFFTEQITTGWTPPQPLPSLLNTAAHDIIQDFNADGRILYFFKGHHLQSGTLLTDTFQTGEDVQLYPDRFPGPVAAELGDRDLFFFNDSTLLFSGRRPEGLGGTDLYLLAHRGGRWQAPHNLGPRINSPYDERIPVLTPDGRHLYFSSNRARQSMGGFDIFLAEFADRERTWSEPKNLGAPINSAGDDLYFRPAADGIKAFLASDRPGGSGGFDLYVAFFKQPQQEQMRPQEPFVSFLEVMKADSSVFASQRSAGEEEKTPYNFKMLFYDSEEDLTNRKNQASLDQAAVLLKNFPELQMAIQSHSDDTETPLHYDLYYSLKRAERAKNYLLQQGVDAVQVAVQGLGAQYPQAMASLEGQDNPPGRALNRRLHFVFLQQKDLPLLLSVDAPIISTFMQTNFANDFYNTIDGLSYRVEVIRTNGIYNNPAFGALPDPMVEQGRGESAYRYSAGLFRQYDEARAFADSLPEKGFPQGRVYPYLYGIRMNEEEVTLFLDRFPDLLRYLAGEKN